MESANIDLQAFACKIKGILNGSEFSLNLILSVMLCFLTSNYNYGTKNIRYVKQTIIPVFPLG